MLNKILSIFLVFSFISINANISFAKSVSITKQKLTSALQNFSKTNIIDDNNYNITVRDNVILIDSDNGNFTVNYNLKNNPIFSYTLNIQKGMSYETLKEEMKNLYEPTLICYLAVANINEIDFKNAAFHFMLSALNSSSGETNIALNDVPFIIVSDDVNTTITGNTKTIKESEFGNRVVEYTKAVYGKKESISDSKNINSFKCVKELKEINDNLCKIIVTLTINLDTDFSKLKK
jgi:hypothetical protein